MTKFELNKELSSYEITRDLVKCIEDYLLKGVLGIIGTDIDTEEIKKGYSLQITDHLGVEEFGSIEQYPSSLFLDSTKQISFYFSPPGVDLTVRICFNIQKDFSIITIEYIGKNAREITTGIYEGFIRIIDSNKTKNRFYYTTLVEISTLLTAGALLPSTPLLFKERLYTWGIMSTCVFAIIVLFMTVGRKINPYMLFESRRSREYKKWSNWFLKGILTFIIFDVILMFILKMFYGM